MSTLRRPVKILVVAACPFPYGRGTPLRIQRLAEGLADQGHSVRVVTYPIGSDASTRGIQVVRIHNHLPYRRFDAGPSIQKPLLDLLLAVKIRKLLRTDPVDVVYAHHFEGALAALLGRIGHNVPVVYDAHTTLAGELASYHRFLGIWPVTSIAGWLDSFVPRRADHVICVSEEIAEFLRAKHIDHERISVIPDGTEVDAFSRASAARARAAFDVADKPTVLYTGNFAPFQGIEYLLRALPRVRERVPEVQLVLAGSGSFTPYNRLLSDLDINEAVHVISNPSFTDTVDLLALPGVAVLPRTVCPGIPLKLLNYMAAAKPIVAFAGSGKTLRHMQNGYIAANGDLDDLARGVSLLLQDQVLAQRLGVAAKQVILEQFLWDRLAEEVSAVFGSLAGAEPAEPVTEVFLQN